MGLVNRPTQPARMSLSGFPGPARAGRAPFYRPEPLPPSPSPWWQIPFALTLLGLAWYAAWLVS